MVTTATATGGAEGVDISGGVIGDDTSIRDILATPAAEFGGTVSPDGNWIAYTSNATGTFEVYIQRFPDGGGRLPVSVGGAAYQHWSADGSSLTYMSFDFPIPQAMMRVPVTGLDRPDTPVALGSPVALFQWEYFTDVDARPHFDMTADGERFLTIADDTPDSGSDANKLILVQNWFEDLNRLVPVE